MNDLEKVTKRAYGMIAYAGMGEKLPNVCYYDNQEYQFAKPYSEKTAETIDEEVRSLIAQEYARAKSVLLEHKDGHAQLTQILVEREVIFAEDLEKSLARGLGYHAQTRFLPLATAMTTKKHLTIPQATAKKTRR